MNTKRTYGYLTWLLLIAILSAIVPVHQIFHKHDSLPKIEKGYSSQVVIKKTAKPCCKPFESVGAAVLMVNRVFISSLVYDTLYLLSLTDDIILKGFYHFVNKAPPVAFA